MKKKFLLLIPSIFAVFSCTANYAKGAANANTINTSNNNNNNNKNEETTKITIKFDSNGGELTGLSSFKVDSGSTFSSFKSKQPTVERKSSSGTVTDPGWFIKNGSSKVLVDDNTTFSSDTTLYANWSTYKVKFNSGLGKWSDTEAGATKEISETMYVHSDDVAKPTYAGGKFLGWYDGDNEVSFPYTPSSDVTLTAKYDVKQISLFFYAGDGYFNSSTTTKTVTFKVPYDTTWENVKKNTSFPKVDVESDDLLFDQYLISGAAIEDSYKFTSSKVIKANFSAAYAVTFDIATNNGQWVGTSSSESKKVKIKRTDSHTFADFKTVGEIPTSKSATGSYDELGWFTDSEADTDAISDSETITESKTVYAYYKVPHSITFNGSNFTVSETISTFIKKDQIQYTIVPTYAYAISKSQVVVKWNGETKTEGEDKDYTYTVDSSTGYGTLLIKSAPGYDITVNLNPTVIYHKVTVYYNDDASTVKTVASNVKHGTVFNESRISFSGITKTDYTFVRWYSDENMNIKYDFTQKVETDLVLYAQWKPAELDKDSCYMSTEDVEVDGTTYHCLTDLYYWGNDAPTKFTLPSTDNDDVPITGIGTKDSSFNWDSAFANTTEIYLPDSYKFVGNSVFESYSLENLTKVNIDNIEVFCSYCFYGRDFIKDINLPNCKKFYPDEADVNAFSSCQNITKIINIGQCTNFPSLFSGCSNITSVNIPETVTGTINATQFSDCSLTNLYVEDGNTAYTSRDENNKECNVIVTNDDDKKLIMGCLNSIVPTNCTEICDGAFSGCGITKIDIPDSVKKIGSNAFYNCSLLEEVNFGENSNCAEICDRAFSGSGITEIDLPDSVEKIGSNAFSGCENLKKATFPKNCDTIGDYAFYNCPSLEEIEWNDKITSLPNYLFGFCTSLKSVTIPETIKTIGNSCFYYCKSLENITIGSNVETIGTRAFYGVAASTINIPASVTTMYASTFEGCKNLTNLVIDENNAVYSNKYNGVDVKGVVQGDTFFFGTQDSIIPEGITSIGESAFRGHYTSTSMPTLPSTCTSIGSYAFYACSSLTEITLDYVTDIGENAFDDCSNVETIKLKSVKTIGTKGSSGYGNVFGDCKKLTALYLPKTIEYIRNGSFYITFSGTVNVDIYYEGSEEEWNTAVANFQTGWSKGLNYTMHYNSWNP